MHLRIQLIQRFRYVVSCCLMFFVMLPAHSAYAETLVIAQLSDRPKKDFKELRPMVQHIAARLSAVGITDGTVKLYSDIEELTQAVKSGEVHWVTETPYTAAVLVHEANAVPMLSKWKSGQRQYQTLIYTHRDSGLYSVQDLQGKRIAFEHSQSFSSYYLPRLLLEQQGLTLTEMPGLKAKTADGAINYLFSRNEKNNLLWVHKQLVEAGALNDGDWNNTSRVPAALKADLRIIYRSEPVPRALELISPKVRPEVAQALKDILLNMTPETDGDLLARYEKTTGFEIPPPQLPQMLKEIYTTSQRWSQ